MPTFRLLVWSVVPTSLCTAALLSSVAAPPAGKTTPPPLRLMEADLRPGRRNGVDKSIRSRLEVGKVKSEKLMCHPSSTGFFKSCDWTNNSICTHWWCST